MMIIRGLVPPQFCVLKADLHRERIRYFPWGGDIRLDSPSGALSWQRPVKASVLTTSNCFVPLLGVVQKSKTLRRIVSLSYENLLPLRILPCSRLSPLRQRVDALYERVFESFVCVWPESDQHWLVFFSHAASIASSKNVGVAAHCGLFDVCVYYRCNDYSA
jgi:hypothetical protein